MLLRLQLCLATALLIALPGNASADSYKPSVGFAKPSLGSAPKASGYSTTEAATDLPSGADAYNQAAVTDPYNQRDFSVQQSFGLTASQMLGAAAACEQLHSDLMSGRRAKPSKDPNDDDRAALDAAQQNMLDPALTSPNPLQTGEVDCDRVSDAFIRLQQIQIRDPDLAKAVGQPDAMSPLPDRNNKNDKGK